MSQPAGRSIPTEQSRTSGGSTGLTRSALDGPGSGLMLPSGGGERIRGGGLDVTLLSAMGPFANTSSFEVRVPAGYDVGVHVHTEGEELFLVLEGTLDVLAFEPVDRSPSDWHEWVSPSGQRFLRGGPGAFMHVPVDTPHAFANPTDQTARMFFQSGAPGGHENYFAELAELLREGKPDASKVAELRGRYDIEQLTPLRAGAS